MPEQWRSIPGYEGHYEVSDLGGVRRVSPAPGTAPGRRLNPLVDSTGYWRVSLSVGNKPVSKSVHRLVAVAFLGPPADPAWQVNHVDGNKLNAALTNLEWVSVSRNRKHAIDNGLQPVKRGDECPWAKLTTQQVAEIRALRGVVMQRVLADRYGISQQQVSRVQRGLRWH